MNRCTTPRRYAVRGRAWPCLIVQLGVLASYNALPAACAPATRYRPPSSARDYQIVITRHDSLSRAIGLGLKQRGFRVRNAVKGGSPPAAYLLAFTQRETAPGSPLWLYIRLADTRTGAIVAAVSAPLDSLGATAEARAQAIVDSLTLRPAALRAPSTP